MPFNRSPSRGDAPPQHNAYSYPQQQQHPQQQQQQQQPAAPPETLLAVHAPAFAPPPPPSTAPSTRSDDFAFDIFEWAPRYASCQRFFLDHAQHSGPVQAVAAFLNILLPCQRAPPLHHSSAATPTPRAPHNPMAPSPSPTNPLGGGAAGGAPAPAPAVSLFPYIRRLVVTGLDFPGVLHGFFGDDWAAGIGPLHEQERRNYLFAAKSGGWATVKREYDHGGGGGGSGAEGGGGRETVPFLRPLQGVVEAEVAAAERSWSEFMAFEDWMVGPRAPAEGEGRRG